MTSLPSHLHATVIQGHTFTVDKRYQPKKLLGRGSFGVVCTAFDSETNTTIAIKRIRPYAGDEWDARHTLREVRLMRLLGTHPNIITLYNLDVYDEKSELYMMIELMDCDLHKIIQSKQSLTDQHFKCFGKQMLEAMKAMHAAGVFHRDLKPGNILVSKDCQLRITDFGLARFMDQNTLDGANSQSPMTEYVVTRWYRCPELLLSPSLPYTALVDIWSIGCILGELVRRKALFPGKSHANQVQLIMELKGHKSLNDLGFPLSPEASSFLERKCKYPGHPLVEFIPEASSECLTVLTNLLELNPSKRPTAADALDMPYFKDAQLVVPPGTYESAEVGVPSPSFFDFDREKYTVEQLREMIKSEVINVTSPVPTSRSKPLQHTKQESVVSTATSAAATASPGHTSAESFVFSPRPQNGSQGPAAGSEDDSHPAGPFYQAAGAAGAGGAVASSASVAASTSVFDANQSAGVPVSSTSNTVPLSRQASESSTTTGNSGSSGFSGGNLTPSPRRQQMIKEKDRKLKRLIQMQGKSVYPGQPVAPEGQQQQQQQQIIKPTGGSLSGLSASYAASTKAQSTTSAGAGILDSFRQSMKLGAKSGAESEQPINTSCQTGQTVLIRGASDPYSSIRSITTTKTTDAATTISKTAQALLPIGSEGTSVIADISPGSAARISSRGVASRSLSARATGRSGAVENTSALDLIDKTNPIAGLSSNQQAQSTNASTLGKVHSPARGGSSARKVERTRRRTFGEPLNDYRLRSKTALGMDQSYLDHASEMIGGGAPSGNGKVTQGGRAGEIMSSTSLLGLGIVPSSSSSSATATAGDHSNRLPALDKQRTGKSDRRSL